MIRSKAALALIVAGALMGCGDDPPAGGASAEAAKSANAAASNAASAASAASSAAAAAQSAAGAAESAAKKADDPATPAPAAGSGAGTGILKYMPAECPEGRVYANVAKVITPDAYPALDKWVTKAVHEGKDPKKSEEILKTLKDGGIEPIKDLKEIAMCGNKDDKLAVYAATMDMSKAANPAEVIAKAMEQGSGKAPKKEEIDGVTYLQVEEGKSWIAIVGKDTIVTSRGKDAVQAAIKGGNGGAAFADATNHVVWADMKEKDIKARVKEAGDNFDVNVVATVGKDAATAKKEFEKVLPEIDKAAEQMPVIKPLLPAVKAAKLEVNGDVLTVTTNFPKKAIGEFFTGIKDMSPDDLMKQLKIR